MFASVWNKLHSIIQGFSTLNNFLLFSRLWDNAVNTSKLEKKGIMYYVRWIYTTYFLRYLFIQNYAKLVKTFKSFIIYETCLTSVSFSI